MAALTSCYLFQRSVSCFSYSIAIGYSIATGRLSIVFQRSVSCFSYSIATGRLSIMPFHLSKQFRLFKHLTMSYDQRGSDNLSVHCIDYPVRVCAVGLSVWFRPYVYLYVYLYVYM